MPATSEGRGVGGRPSRVAAGCDALLDGTLVAFGAWTLFYEVALGGRLSLWWPSLVWLVATVLGVGAHLVVSLLRPGRAWVRRPSEVRSASRPLRVAALPRWVWPLAVGVLAAALLRLSTGAGTRPLPVVVAALVVLALGLVQSLSVLSGSPVEAGPRPTRAWSDLGAVAVAGGLAVLAAASVKVNADDIYYVNRSVWVAEHGFVSLRDTMFGAQTYPSTYGGGLPLTSVEGLYGALAHVFHVQSGDVVYLVVPPVLAFLAGLAIWRLVRAWAVRWRLVALVVSVAFILLSSGSVLGGYSITRIWEGKVAALAVLLPLVWALLARSSERGSLVDTGMLLACGVCFVGLSSTAPLQVPMIAVPALVAAVLLRSRGLAWGAGALLLPALVAGLVQAFGAGAVGGAHPSAMSVARAWSTVLGSRPGMVALGVVAFAVAVRLPRGNQPVVVACASGAALMTLLPGMFVAINAVTGAGPVEWRLLLGVPVPVLVGLLAATPLPAGVGGRVPPVAAGLTAAALVAALLAWQGRPLWGPRPGAHWAFPPVWKVDPAALATDRAVMHSGLGSASGPWLLPVRDMGMVAELTTRHAAVVPRAFYFRSLHEPPADRNARLLLLHFELGIRVEPGALRHALAHLHVSLACVGIHEPGRAVVLATAVGGRGHRVDSLTCHALGPGGVERDAQNFWSSKPVSTS